MDTSITVPVPTSITVPVPVPTSIPIPTSITVPIPVPVPVPVPVPNILDDINHESVWMAFKQIISKISVSDDLNNEIIVYSAELNKLQKSKNFNEIHNMINIFLTKNMDEIITNMFIYGNNNDMYILYIRVIKRWCKIHEDFILYTKGLTYQLFISSVNYIKNYDDRYDAIVHKIRNYFLKCKNLNKFKTGCLNFDEQNSINNEIKNIFECALKNKCTSIINAISTYSDLNVKEYYKPEYKKYSIIKNDKIYKFISDEYL